MPHLPPAHHKTSKRDSPNETNIKEKQNETIPNSNSNLAKSMTHHNQTTKLTTWFLIQRPVNGYAPVGLGVGGAHVSEVMMPDGIRVGVNSIMTYTRLRECMSEGHQTLLPHDDGALTTVKQPLSGKELLLQFGEHH
jgi:hypothetical protein